MPGGLNLRRRSLPPETQDGSVPVRGLKIQNLQVTGLRTGRDERLPEGQGRLVGPGDGQFPLAGMTVESLPHRRLGDPLAAVLPQDEGLGHIAIRRKAGVGLVIDQDEARDLAIDPDQHLVVTCGSTEAMMVAMMTACNPGDKVIIFSPFYENYAADAILSGAEPIYVPLRPPQFGFDPDELARAFAQGAKAIIVCNPSNPTGKVFTRDELLTLDAEKVF